METSTERLEILLLSDIHLNLEYIAQMLEWVETSRKGKKYDFVFMSGDLCNLPNSGPIEKFDQAEVKHHRDALEQYFTQIEAACGKVVLIPGNHDPIEMFG